MSTFIKGGSTSTPFGKREYLRSTRGTKFESYTVAASTVPARTIDGNAGQKILQPGTVMAKITSGVDLGKVGPFQRGTGAAGAAAVNEVQTVGLGAASAGTITITFDGQTTTALAFNASNAAVLAALESLSNINPGDITVTGGPLPGVITLTFTGALAGTNVPEVTVTPTGLTGGTVAVNTTTQGSAAGVLVGAATDGRGETGNIVGLNDTFLPWQLIERDVEIGVLYIGTAVQGWCVELDATGLEVVLSNSTADAMRSTKGLDITFK